MAVQQTHILLLTLCLLTVVFCHNDQYIYTEKRSNAKYCGTTLVQALQVACGGVYQRMFKKAETTPRYPVLSFELPVYFPFNVRPRGEAMEYRGRRVRRGVIDECCRTGCSFKVLQSYCEDD